MNWGKKSQILQIQEVLLCFIIITRFSWEIKSFWTNIFFYPSFLSVGETLRDWIQWVSIFLWKHFCRKVSSRGLVVKAEDSWLRGCGFKPPTEETIFQAPFIWINSLEQKLIKPGIFAYAVILQKGGWTLRTVGL